MGGYIGEQPTLRTLRAGLLAFNSAVSDIKSCLRPLHVTDLLPTLPTQLRRATGNSFTPDHVREIMDVRIAAPSPLKSHQTDMQCTQYLLTDVKAEFGLVNARHIKFIADISCVKRLVDANWRKKAKTMRKVGTRLPPGLRASSSC